MWRTVKSVSLTVTARSVTRTQRQILSDITSRLKFTKSLNKGRWARLWIKERKYSFLYPTWGVCGMIWLSFLCSNQIREWKWQQASKKDLLVAACLADKGAAGALQTVCCFQRHVWCLPLNNRHNKSTAGREMEGENRLEGVHVRFLNKMEAGLRSGGVEIQTFGRKRQLSFRCDFLRFLSTQHNTQTAFSSTLAWKCE